MLRIFSLNPAVKTILSLVVVVGSGAVHASTIHPAHKGVRYLGICGNYQVKASLSRAVSLSEESNQYSLHIDVCNESEGSLSQCIPIYSSDRLPNPPPKKVFSFVDQFPFSTVGVAEAVHNAKNLPGTTVMAVLLKRHEVSTDSVFVVTQATKPLQNINLPAYNNEKNKWNFRLVEVAPRVDVPLVEVKGTIESSLLTEFCEL